MYGNVRDSTLAPCPPFIHTHTRAIYCHGRLRGGTRIKGYVQSKDRVIRGSLTVQAAYCTIVPNANNQWLDVREYGSKMSAFDLTSSLGSLLVSFAVQTLIYAGFLWCAMKIIRIKGTFVVLLLVSAIAAALGFIPYAGPLIGLVALVLLINRFTSAGKTGSVIMVLIAWALGIGATIGLLELIELVSDTI